MFVVLAFLMSWPTFAATEKLHYSAEEILKAVAQRKGITLRADILVPVIFFESSTPLKQFQDAVEPQWGIRPERFVNVYVPARNEIYLIDSSDFYKPDNRFLDDSLAHEFTHYIQVKYQGFTEQDGDDLEADAVSVQTWFRENYFAP